MRWFTGFAWMMTMAWLLMMPVFAAEGGTFKLRAIKTWTVDEARTEAFKDLPVANLAAFPSFDPDRLANKQAIRRNLEKVADRSITVFSNGFYGVTHLCANRNFFYLPTGQLAAVQFNNYAIFTDDSCPERAYPHKSYKYLFPSSQLVSVTIYVSDSESYTFHPDGRMLSHWRDNQCTMADGTSCGTRE